MLGPDREGLESVADHSAKARRILDDAPEVPPETAYIWGWFAELHASRSAGMDQNPIQFSEIEAWARLTGNRPFPWEVALLKRLDLEYLKSTAPKPAK